MCVKLTHEPIDLLSVVDAVRDPAAGAIATFLGTTRNHHNGREVIRLDYEAYPAMAEKELKKICETVRNRWRATRVAIVHRVGRVEIGESSVAIAVSSPHRKEAFEACQYAIDTLKKTVPIWKKESYKDGETWIGSQDGLTEFSTAEQSIHGLAKSNAEQK